jgi:hypothetical protein
MNHWRRMRARSRGLRSSTVSALLVLGAATGCGVEEAGQARPEPMFDGLG